MQKIFAAVKVLGFPIVIAFVLLYFSFCTIERNTQAIHNLDKSINTLIVLLTVGHSDLSQINLRE